MEMKKYKLGDIAKTSSGGTPKSTIAEYYEGGNIPWINSGELGNPFITSTNNFITKKGYDNSSAKLFPPQTVLLAMYGATAGKVSLLEIEACTNQAICAIMPNKDILLPIYLKYKLDTMYNYLVRLSTGSARDNLSQDGIKAIELSIPSLSVQQKIATVLSTLDKRIENLRAQNRVLEQTAKTIYDYTFLQCAGHQTTFNKTLNRNIPEDWEVKKLGDCLASISTGLNPRQNFTLGNGSIKYITVKNLTLDGSIDYSGCDFIDENARAKVHKRSNIKVGDILFASISPLGRCYLIQEKPEDWDINESVFSISPADFTTSYYLYSFLRSKEFVAKAEQRATGSIFLGIRVDTLKKMEVLWPDSKTLGRFNALIEPIFKKQLVNTKQIETLITQRNTLLPLLMTGQVEV